MPFASLMLPVNNRPNVYMHRVQNKAVLSFWFSLFSVLLSICSLYFLTHFSSILCVRSLISVTAQLFSSLFWFSFVDYVLLLSFPSIFIRLWQLLRRFFFAVPEINSNFYQTFLILNFYDFPAILRYSYVRMHLFSLLDSYFIINHTHTNALLTSSSCIA